jgi:hypothetical protein
MCRQGTDIMISGEKKESLAMACAIALCESDTMLQVLNWSASLFQKLAVWIHVMFLCSKVS